MLSIIQNIPNVNTYPLTYVFKNMKLQHKPNTLWLEFGVASGDDRKSWAAGSGCIPFYNHSDIPNIVKKGDLKNDTMTIYALVDIKKDEELMNTYFSKQWRACFQDF